MIKQIKRITEKTCTRCNETFPRTEEYFLYDKSTYYWSSWCLECRGILERERELNIRACSKCDREFPATTEYFSRIHNSQGEWRLMRKCKGCMKKKVDEWFGNNKERHNRNCRQYRRKQWEEMSDRHIIHTRNLYDEDITQEMIDTYRLILTIKRIRGVTRSAIEEQNINGQYQKRLEQWQNKLNLRS